MATESSVNVPNTGTAPVRVLQVTTLIAGVPTVVDMQVLSIADANGNVIDFGAADRQNFEILKLILIEQRVSNAILAEGLNVKTDLDSLRVDPYFAAPPDYQ